MNPLSFLGLGGSKRASGKANESAALQRGVVNDAFDDAQGFLSPVAQQGGQAQSLYLALIGALGPEAQAQAQQDYIDDPGTSFLRDQGLAGIDSGAAASGGLLSGRTDAARAKYATGLAQQSFGNRLSHLGRAGSQGIGASTALANLATGRGNALSGIEANRGAASQRGVLGQQEEALGLTKGLVSLGSFALSGGFDKGLSALSGGNPIARSASAAPDFRRVY